MYIRIILIGVVVLLVFRLLSFLNRILPLSKEFKHYSGYLLPVAEFFVWLGFLIWSIRKIYESESYVTVVVFGIALLLLIIPVWFFMRDFLYGLLLKIQRKIEVGNRVEIGEIAGVIVKTDYLSFDVKNPEGDIFTVPFNKIRSNVISKQGTNASLEKHSVQLKIISSEEESQVLKRVNSMLMLAPWIGPTQTPIVKNIEKKGEEYLLTVIVQILKKEHALKIRDYVQKAFE